MATFGSMNRSFRKSQALRERIDPTLRLMRSHSLAASSSNVETAAVFGDDASRTQPVTFAFKLKRTGVGAGLVFEFGSATRGVACYVSGADLIIVAGAGTVSANDGVTLTLTNALPLNGEPIKFVVSVTPGTGNVSVYQLGRKIGFANAVSGSFAGAWADSAAGAVGNVQGASSNRVPGGSQVALSNVSMIGNLDVFLHQKV